MKTTIEKFYQAFSDLDAEAMTDLYHEEIIFNDPAFGMLDRTRAGNMWKMLCKTQKNKDFRIKVYDIEATDTTGKARWEAFYTFSKTGRKVHNVIHATYAFKDGKIIRHTDEFDLYKWARQALGLKGMLFGWTPYFKSQLNAQTSRLLDKFEESLPEADAYANQD